MQSALDLVGLRYVVEVAQAGSLAKAAARLGVNPATVSRHLSRVEDRLGVTLFERSRLGVRMTCSGRAVVAQIRRVIDELDGVAAVAQGNGGGCAGSIRLGLRTPPVSGVVSKALKEWRLLHPNIVLRFIELGDHELRVALTERRMDAAFVAHPTLWSGLGVAGVPMMREAISVAVPVDHELASHEKLTWRQLGGETFLTQSWSESQFAREFLASAIGSPVAFESHAISKQSILALVAAGYGVTLVTESQAQAVLPGLVFRPIDEADAWADIDLVWLPGSEDAATGVFVAFMRDRAAIARP